MSLISIIIVLRMLGSPAAQKFMHIFVWRCVGLAPKGGIPSGVAV